MKKEITANRRFRVFKCFMCLVFLYFLSIDPVSAVLDCVEPDPIDEQICQIKMHLPEPQNDPRLEELRELPKTKWCTHCHEVKNVNP
jgi:hypothetical protein